MLALVDTNNKFCVFGKKMQSNDSVCNNSRVYTTALSKPNFLKLKNSFNLILLPFIYKLEPRFFPRW